MTYELDFDAQVIDQEITVFVVAVDKREREEVYRKAADRLS